MTNAEFNLDLNIDERRRCKSEPSTSNVQRKFVSYKNDCRLKPNCPYLHKIPAVMWESLVLEWLWPNMNRYNITIYGMEWGKLSTERKYMSY